VQIAFVLYPAFTALDIVGPFNVHAYGPDLESVRVRRGDPRPRHRRHRRAAHASGAHVRRVHGDEVARAIQLGNEYDPQPPYDAGSPRTAPAHVVAAWRSRGA
jgi:hypothetical protein